MERDVRLGDKVRCWTDTSSVRIGTVCRLTVAGCDLKAQGYDFIMSGVENNRGHPLNHDERDIYDLPYGDDYWYGAFKDCDAPIKLTARQKIERMLHA
jgi:hypothetical protein